MTTLAMLVGTVAISRLVPMTGIDLGARAFVFIPLVLILLSRAAAPKEAQILHNVVRCPAIRLVAVQMDDKLELLNAAHGGFDGAQPPAVESPLGSSPLASSDGVENLDTGGLFTRRVRKVAQIYLLTERETDILFDLAKGNTAAYIQEKHCILAGTIKTHVRNIYRKLDIHKRNDLMRLIEDIDGYV